LETARPHKYNINRKGDKSTIDTARRSCNQVLFNRSKHKKQKLHSLPTRRSSDLETPSRVLCSTVSFAVSPFSPLPHVQIPLGETIQFFNRRKQRQQRWHAPRSAD